MECATEVCGCRHVGQVIRKGGKWWNDEARIAVVQNRKVFEQWLQRETEKAYDEYREKKRRELFNVQDGVHARVVAVGDERRMPVFAG